MLHTEQQLQTLATLLRALPIENDGMTVSELDGFATGVLVCRDMIMPSEWLPIVWGDDIIKAFKDDDQLKITLNAVMDHYNRISRILASSPDAFQALFDVDLNSGETLWASWISGFERAMQLRPDSWESMVGSEDESTTACISIIVTLHKIDQGTSELPKKFNDQLEGLVASYITSMVITLNNWSKSRLINPVEDIGAAKSNVIPFKSSQVGSNDLRS